MTDMPNIEGLHDTAMILGAGLGLAVSQAIQNARHQADMARARQSIAAYDSALRTSQTVQAALIERVVSLTDEAEQARDEADALKADLVEANELIRKLTAALKRYQN